ncbi:MAG TPA: TonB-dependent receptor [Flavipsychrobacter sp.]|nr:TonB-dependent receptor [Flavipsychrobacter sp.]
MKHIATIALLCSSISVAAQTSDSLTQQLTEVQIRAFEQNKSLQDVPASINYIGNRQLHRFNNTNILPALNATPGVRMEERSPGSYRLSIRGSSLRSPFGVRNIKVYYNDIPFTDPGGHTYLNQLGFYNFQSVEIIKGPGSSLYGAGTGGVMLINSMPANFREGATVSYTGGSYGLHNTMAEVRFGNHPFQNVVRYQHLQSDGYREHSALRRAALSWDAKARIDDRNELTAHFLYGDMNYQTPGARTLEEFEVNPRSARPSVTFAPGFTVPGSKEMNAAIYEKTFLAGASLKHKFSERFQNTTTLYGAYTQLRNPTIRNYGRSSEPHTGGRTTFKYGFDLGNSKLDWLAGGEVQQGFTSVRIYDSRMGTPDSLQTDDELHIRQYFGFTQLTWTMNKFVVTAGLSLNKQQVSFTRFSNPPATEYTKYFNNQLAPRLAVLYKALPGISVYGSAAKGFSPPTSAELSPSGGVLNSSLNAEDGWNYEIGTRGHVLNNKLYFDINAFYFNLNNTIVQRRDSLSGDYFLNAGSTKQLGVESYLSYRLLSPASFVWGDVWASYTWYDFKYDEFVQVENNFSGNKLPSVAPHTLSVGVDLRSRIGLYTNITYYYSDRIALTDANDAFANSYSLVGLRLGYKKEFAGRYMIDVFAGGDNLLDETYSLGNDINGFGGRYYNAAMGRNYYAGVSVSWNK